MIHVLFVFSDWALLFLRVILGIVLLVHGLPKLQSFKKRVKKSTGTFAALVECIGGIALIAGILTQLFALLVFIRSLVVLFTVKRGMQFVKVETDLIILASSAILVTSGSGIYSLESVLGFVLY